MSYLQNISTSSRKNHSDYHIHMIKSWEESENEITNNIEEPTNSDYFAIGYIKGYNTANCKIVLEANEILGRQKEAANNVVISLMQDNNKKVRANNFLLISLIVSWFFIIYNLID